MDRSGKDLVPLVGALIVPHTVSGSFVPAPRQGIVDVQRLGPDGRWTLVARGLTNRVGAYSVPVYGSGEYRVLAGGVVASPVVAR